MLELKNACKTFSDVQILNGVIVWRIVMEITKGESEL
jgi:hypothetical protein